MAEEVHKTKSEFIQTWVQIVVVAAAFAWGVYTFVYQQTIVPHHLPPYLTVTSSLEKVGENASLIAIKGRVHAKNTSKTRVWIVASWYNAYGMRISPTEMNDAQFTRYVTGHITEPETMFPRHFEVTQFTTVLARRFMDEFWFDPDDDWGEEFQFYVPRGRYDQVTLGVDLDIAKDNRLTGAKWRVGPNPAIKDDQTPAGVLWAQACEKPNESEKDLSNCELLDIDKHPEHKKFQEKYALSHTSSRSELSLMEANPAKRLAPNQ